MTWDVVWNELVTKVMTEIAAYKKIQFFLNARNLVHSILQRL